MKMYVGAEVKLHAFLISAVAVRYSSSGRRRMGRVMREVQLSGWQYHAGWRRPWPGEGRHRSFAVCVSKTGNMKSQ